MKISELSVGHLCAKILKDAIDELGKLNPETEADNFLYGWRLLRNAGRGNHVKVLTTPQVAYVVKMMLKQFGQKPVSYEVKVFIGKTITRNSAIVGKTYKDEVQSPVREVGWSNKSLQTAVEMSNYLALLGITFYVTGQNTVKIYAAEDCFVSSILASDLPAEWDRLNAVKFEALKKRRQIKEVKDKLDRVTK